jgi:hypothetical protein
MPAGRESVILAKKARTELRGQRQTTIAGVTFTEKTHAARDADHSTA